MIDIETEVFNNVATALRTAFSGIFVSGDDVAAPSTFPAATLVEKDNATHIATLSSEMQENHADLMYQAEAYSNLTSGRKVQCKAIMAVIDTQMLGMGFTRIASGPQELPNADSSKCRMVARYRGVASAKTISGSDTICQIYRR